MNDWRCALGFLVVMLGAGCGESADVMPPPEPEFPPTSDSAWVRGEQTGEIAGTTLTLPDFGEIRSVGAAGGELYVGASTGLYVVDQDALEFVPVYVEGEEELTTTGGVIDMAVSGDVMIIAADDGLFHIQDWALLRSPLSDVVGDLQIHALSVTETGVWIGAQEGLFRITDNAMESISLGDGGAVVDLAVIPGTALLAYGANHTGKALSYVLDTSTMESDWTPNGVPAVNLAGWGEVLVMGGKDLLVRGGDGAWTRWSDLQVSAVGSSADGLHLATDDGIYRLTDDAEGPGLTPVANVGDLSDALGVGMDTYGHLWTATVDTVTRWETGSAITFEDVQGIFSAQCAWCHATGLNAPKRDFEDYALVYAMLEPITEYIALDLMPPSGMGGPVSDADKLLLQRWIDGGAAP